MGLFDNQQSTFFSFDPSTASNTKYDVPVAKELDSNQAYNQALKYNQFAQDQALSGQSAAQRIAKGDALDTYQGKASIDSSQKLLDLTNASTIANPNGLNGLNSATTNQLALLQNQQQEALKNRSNESIETAKQLAFQGQQGAANRQSQEKIAGLQAQANIASSLFGAFGQRKQSNFWG